MNFLWRGDHDSHFAGYPFPSKKMQSVLGIDPHLYAIGLYRKSEMVAHSESLSSRFSRHIGFIGDPFPIIATISSAAMEFIRTTPISHGFGDYTFPVDEPENHHHSSFLRLLWRPLNETVNLLVLSLQKTQDHPHGGSDASVADFLMDAERYLSDHDDDLALDYFIRSLGDLSSSDIHGDREFIRYVRDPAGILRERVCNADNMRFDRIIADGSDNVIERLMIVSQKRTLQHEIKNDPNVLRVVRFRIGCFIGGLYPVGFLSISGTGFESSGSKLLISRIRRISHGDLGKLPFCSKKYTVFGEWISPPGAFPLSFSARVFSSFPKDSLEYISVPIPSMMSQIDAVFRRLRSNDLLFYDEMTGEGYILLRGCTDLKVAERTVVRDLKERGVLVGEPSYLSEIFEEVRCQS